MEIVLQSLLLLLCVNQITSYTYSCNEVKYRFIGATFDDSLKYACVIPQEGYNDFPQLNNIYVVAEPAHLAYTFLDISRKSEYCVEAPAGQPWKLNVANGFDLHCKDYEEFSLVMSSEPLDFVLPKKEYHTHVVLGSQVVVVPQTGVVMKKNSCYGTGSVTISTGAGAGMKENRYEYRTWPCSSLPEWIIIFDTVFTINAVDASYTADYSTDLSFDLKPHKGDRIVILSSGKSNDQQNLRGIQNRVTFDLLDGDFQTITMNMQLQFDKDNYGSVVLINYHDASSIDYYNGTQTVAFTSNYFQVHYAPQELQPQQVYYNEDIIIVDISIGEQGTTLTKPATTIATTQPIKTTVTTPAKIVPTNPTTVQTVKTTTGSPPKTTRTTTHLPPTTSQPHSSGADAYCNCGVDKFGFPNGWNYNDIWLDIVVILDTSEAMGEDALADAGALIESFISDGFDDFLITDPTAPLYTRVGVITMSDTVEVLYNLNMTKYDKIQGKATIKKGVHEINILDAFDAALTMFTNGLKDKPERTGTRPVIYYMTDSNPGANLNPLNQFKTSQGIIIVDNFLEEGEIEIPRLRDLASPGYYFVNSNYMEGLQAFCKANCFCKANRDTYKGTDPAVAAAGGCYHASPSGIPFNKALSTCMSDGGILATIHDEEKGRFLQNLMTRVSSKSDYFWMGYQKSDAGEWQWEDDSSDSFTNWDVNEPSDAAVAKCAYIDLTTPNLSWGAGNCQIGFPYVCQYAPCSVGNKDC